MAEVKINVGHKGKTYNITQDVESFKNKKIHDNISGDMVGLKGYELEITGGSDRAGFPMRFDIQTPRKKILMVSGIGTRNKVRGKKVRKTVAGNMVTDYTAQINLKVIKEGSKSIEESLGIAPKETAEAVKAEAWKN